MAVLRQLYRICCDQRVALATESYENDFHNSNKELNDNNIGALNIIITITGQYFGQGEKEDFVEDN